MALEWTLVIVVLPELKFSGNSLAFRYPGDEKCFKKNYQQGNKLEHWDVACNSMWIKVGNRELKEVDHFKYLGNVLTRDGYCTREIKMRVVISKEAF